MATGAPTSKQDKPGRPPRYARPKERALVKMERYLDDAVAQVKKQQAGLVRQAKLLSKDGELARILGNDQSADHNEWLSGMRDNARALAVANAKAAYEVGLHKEHGMRFLREEAARSDGADDMQDDADGLTRKLNGALDRARQHDEMFRTPFHMHELVREVNDALNSEEKGAWEAEAESMERRDGRLSDIDASACDNPVVRQMVELETAKIDSVVEDIKRIG